LALLVRQEQDLSAQAKKLDGAIVVGDGGTLASMPTAKAQQAKNWQSHININ
jgi:hypothetical protein